MNRYTRRLLAVLITLVIALVASPAGSLAQAENLQVRPLVVSTPHVRPPVTVVHKAAVHTPVKKAVSFPAYGWSARRLEAARLCIIHRESRGNPKAINRSSGDSGLYQYDDRLWKRFMGYAHAYKAPAWVQTVRFYKSWGYWLSHWHGKASRNPWYWAGHSQCW